MPFIYLPSITIFAKKESDNQSIAWQRHRKKLKYHENNNN